MFRVGGGVSVSCVLLARRPVRAKSFFTQAPLGMRGLGPQSLQSAQPAIRARGPRPPGGPPARVPCSEVPVRLRLRPQQWPSSHAVCRFRTSSSP